MIPFTGACERPWAIALSRSSRPTAPTRRPSSTTRIPLWPWRWQSDHRVRDGLVRADRRAGRDMTSPAAHRLARRGAKRRRAEPRAPRRARRARSPTPPRGGRRRRARAADRRRVDLRRPAARDAEHALVHLDEQDERAAVGQVDDLVREVRDAVHVPRPGDGRDAARRSRRRARRLEPADQRAEQLALLVARAACAGSAASRSWRAPWRRHQASASASRWVAVG